MFQCGGASTSPCILPIPDRISQQPQLNGVHTYGCGCFMFDDDFVMSSLIYGCMEVAL